MILEGGTAHQPFYHIRSRRCSRGPTVSTEVGSNGSAHSIASLHFRPSYALGLPPYYNLPLSDQRGHQLHRSCSLPSLWPGSRLQNILLLARHCHLQAVTSFFIGAFRFAQQFQHLGYTGTHTTQRNARANERPSSREPLSFPRRDRQFPP